MSAQPDPGCPSTGQHGTERAYNHHRCRCPDARNAARVGRQRRASRFYPGGFRDATGTRRRLEALMAIGWRRVDLAAHLGVAKTTFDEYGTYARVLARTADAMAALYDELADQPGPSDVTRRRAAAAGFIPPIGWDDNIDDPAALPFEERMADGSVRSRWRPCQLGGCRQYAQGTARYCTERHRRVGDCAAVERHRAADRERAQARAAMRRLGVAS